MSHRLDIPLDRDGSGRFLPWLIALMVYLAALATSGVLALNYALDVWDTGLSGTLTVEIPAAANGSATGDGGLAAALAALKATPGVVSATAIDRAATMKLIEPWLGSTAAPDELPLPRLIDVRIDASRGVDLVALKARLGVAAPDAVLADQGLWLDKLQSFVVAIEATALVIVALIIATAVLTVVFTTRAGLGMHHDVIELLHLMGARDRYIAGQFQREAMRLGLIGGAIGLALAVVTLLGLGHIAHATALGAQFAFMPTLRLMPWHWIALALLPAGAALIAMLTARLTVLGALARMP